MFVENLREKYRALRTRASESRDSREGKNHAVRRRGVGGERRDRPTIRTVRNVKLVASHSRKNDAREDGDAKGPNSRLEWLFQGCNGAGGRRSASPYENTRPVLRPNWLSPGALSCSRRKQTFLGYHAAPSFFSSHPFEAGY